MSGTETMTARTMNRDFEVRQLLRAFRSGVLSEAAFEDELTRIEHEAGDSGQSAIQGFEAGGRTYRSEREAVLTFLDELHAAQMDAAIGFAKWSSVCQSRGLRTGLAIAAERNVYHTRVIQHRVRELGGSLRSVTTEEGTKLSQVLADSEISDFEKLSALIAIIRDPRQAIEPLVAFASALKSDVETKQALRLFAEDDLSTATWLRDALAATAAAA
jgi:hypothetical protein